MEKSEERKSGSSNVANKKSSLRTVGEFLREARQGRNLSVEELSSLIKIGKEQLIALESGDESALPEKVFVRAMVRRIAEKLNLDTSFIFDELNEKKKNEIISTPIIKKEKSQPSKNFNIFSMVILSGILGIFASNIVLKYIQSNQNESKNIEKSEITLLNKHKYF